jgi:hypothetical protein
MPQWMHHCVACESDLTCSDPQHHPLETTGKLMDKVVSYSFVFTPREEGYGQKEQGSIDTRERSD